MSLFNTIVPVHPWSPLLLLRIKWANHGHENKYPILGRLRYVWMNKEYNQVKLLLKNGSESWAEKGDNENLLQQIKSHETFISVEELERDPVYIIATFGLIDLKKLKLVSPRVVSELRIFFAAIKAVDDGMVESGEFSITKDPFEIFDEAMQIAQQLPKGVYPNQELKHIGEVIEQFFDIKKPKE